ncbi:helix-turn-helix domain-containing protein [Nakamurella sp.]|uniref:helix-turn-helix domain-containing protein n=1 Tax=Nakamurella sp. TaxID=1869182 RepID=UPI003B3B512E
MSDRAVQAVAPSLAGAPIWPASLALLPLRGDRERTGRESVMERTLLTAEEAAESLKVGRCKVYDLIRSGELESIKIGRLRRIPVDSLRRFAQRLLAEGLE